MNQRLGFEFFERAWGGKLNLLFGRSPCHSRKWHT